MSEIAHGKFKLKPQEFRENEGIRAPAQLLIVQPRHLSGAGLKRLHTVKSTRHDFFRKQNVDNSDWCDRFHRRYTQLVII